MKIHEGTLFSAFLGLTLVVGVMRLCYAQAEPDTAQPTTSEKAATETPVAEAPKSKASLAVRQERLGKEFRDVEGLILRLAESYAKSDPRKATLLRKAYSSSKDRRIDGKFSELVELLAKEKLFVATKSQAEVQVDLQKLLDLILSGDIDRQIQNERKLIKEAIIKLEQIRLREVENLEQTENQGDLPDLSKSEERNIGRLEGLFKDLQALAELRNGGANGAPGDKSDGAKSGDAKSEDKKSKDGDAKSEDAKKGDSKGGSGDPSDSDKSKDGKSGDSKSGDGKKSDGKQSDGKQSDGKKGDDKKGDGKEGDAKKSDGKKSDADKGDSKKNDDKKGDDNKGDDKKGDSKSDSKSSDGKDSDSKKGDAKGDSSDSKDGKSSKSSSKSPPAEGSGESSEGDESESEDTPPEQSDPADVPARKRVKAAEERMKEAKLKLEKANRKGAAEEQKKAIEELEQAKAELEEILRQLREEEVERVLAQLESRFRKMLDMQVQVHAGTLRLDRVSENSRGRETEIEAVRLSRKEKDIADECQRAIMLMREEGSAVAFPEAAEQMREDMLQVMHRLERANVAAITQNLELDIVKALEEMIAALKKAQKDAEAAKGSSPPPGGPSAGQPQPLVDKIAELKMIRALQMRVNTRTQSYGKMLTDPEVESADKPELIEALDRLSEREERIYRITRDIVVGKNEGAE